MDQAATDMNAQITKIKADNGDTLFLTTSVEQSRWCSSRPRSSGWS